LRLPDSKTGAKVVPLASAALELLTGLPQCAKFVLPAAKGESHYTGLQKDWERIRVRARLPGLRIHDLRHSFASFAVADGNTLFMVGKVLGHKQARTTEGYAHLANDPLRAVADRTAARIAAAMKGERREGAEVVPLPPQKAVFEALLRSPRFEEHRRRLMAEVEHWPPRKDTSSDCPSPTPTQTAEEARFRREIAREVLEAVIRYAWFYYRGFLPDGDAAVRRSREPQ